MAIARAADQSESALDVLGAAEAQLMEVSEKGITHGFQSLDEIVQHSFGSIDNLYKQSREVTGWRRILPISTRMTSGLQKDELIIIAARLPWAKPPLPSTSRRMRRSTRGNRRRFQPGNEQGEPAATNARLAGVGGSAQIADRLPRP